MKLNDILTPTNTIFDAPGKSKKRIFELISELASQAIEDMDEKQIFECLNQRERLGSTYVGHGIAIPHARVKNSTLDHPVGILIHLHKSIPYGNQEDEVVNLLFALLVPAEATEQHLEVLAHLATLFGKADYRDKLRDANSNESLYQIAIAST